MSKVSAAIDYIATHTPARTPQIAQAIGMRSAAVMATLKPAVDSDYLVTCFVEARDSRGHMRRTMEYRLAAGIVESGISWEAYKQKAAARRRLPKQGSEIENRKYPPVLSDPDLDLSPIPSAPPEAAVAVPAPPAPPAPPARPERSPLFTIGNDKRLRLSIGETSLVLSVAETVVLGQFMDVTSMIWDAPPHP
jgi:hypothetical protein